MGGVASIREERATVRLRGLEETKMQRSDPSNVSFSEGLAVAPADGRLRGQNRVGPAVRGICDIVENTRTHGFTVALTC